MEKMGGVPELLKKYLHGNMWTGDQIVTSQ